MKEFLSQNNVEFVEYNVLEDRAALDEMLRLTRARCVPVVAAGEEVMMGFDPARLAQLVARIKQI